MREFDLVVIGSGPAGEKAAIEAAKMRRSTAIVERRSVQGGVCIHTGTIPSKTLRETVLYISGLRQRSVYGLVGGVRANVSVAELMYRKGQVIQQEVDIIQQNMARHRIEVIQGTGRLRDAHTVEVVNDRGAQIELRGEVIVISTGARSWHAPNIEFDHKHIYDAESIINIDELPRSLTIIGGGVIGCEYASIFGHIGVNVTIVDSRERLLSFLDREIADALAYLMRKYRINLVLGDGMKEVFRRDGQVVTVTQSGRRVAADRLLFTAGRVGNTQNLGLENLGIEVDDRGLIRVDSLYRTRVPNIYAVGDVIGFPSLASVSMDQGRLAAIHAFNHGDTSCINSLLPFGIYTIPEVSMVGQTEEALSAEGAEYEVGMARYYELARGQIINDHDGMLKLIFDPRSRRVLGVHIVGERATELIHIGQAVMTFGGTIDYFTDTVFNYPTLSEAYKVAALDGFVRLSARG
ncbi:MAG TPA: Si-specific NAD(P)(+) transhydrogenase [candidate division Zixibacteria bacterium]|nr:Si-specific NAD(P)(+) transhydrogenase [candidate division Zixibacteria bacterium]MDD4917009.1 Si-specific NAD(P)(+) transhydrogenase [candidate division Zixibacteria bacterium]MDM7972600.1 Si-specific NAD(P)(+) transhydrogenase [candidate division Zixibacteria bacterium]HOD66158.1 Si-specific NAD(P)(+) transhydrogenase [candidate division Zixibacteria bacterium]HOZ08687.1 Si-specific NAD(P)(+) transhydrogenase [candidate division Zixibacteria bacterium]